MDTRGLGMNTRLPGGIPDFIEKWSPAGEVQRELRSRATISNVINTHTHIHVTAYYNVGYTLTVASTACVPILMHDVLHPILPAGVMGFTALYWKVGLEDLKTSHTLRRNFPFLIHMRYLFESIRPEIQQYLIESDADATPFSRSMRSTIYQRSKAQSDTRALGTMRDVYDEGYEVRSSLLSRVYRASTCNV